MKYIYRAVDDHSKIWEVEHGAKEEPFLYAFFEHGQDHDNRPEFYRSRPRKAGFICAVERVIHRSAIQFKGSGFYKNDYKDK